MIRESSGLATGAKAEPLVVRAGLAESRIADLLRELHALPLRVDRVRVDRGAVNVAGYPDGARPTSTVSLGGGDAAGAGENVAWTSAARTLASRLVARRCRSEVSGPRASSAELVRAFGDPYDRAAVEAAAIELALAQNRTTWPRWRARRRRRCATASRSTRGASRFRACGRSAADLRPPSSSSTSTRAGATGSSIASPRRGRRRARLQGRGRRRRSCALRRSLPERPSGGRPRAQTGGCAALRDRLSFDAPIVSAEALAAIDPPPAAVNVKPARMGASSKRSPPLRSRRAIAHARTSEACSRSASAAGSSARSPPSSAPTARTTSPRSFRRSDPLRLDPRGASDSRSAATRELTLSRPDDPRWSVHRTRPAREANRHAVEIGENLLIAPIGVRGGNPISIESESPPKRSAMARPSWS